MASRRFLPTELLARRQLTLLVLCSTVNALGMVLLAFGLGTWIASMTDGDSQKPLLWLALTGAGLRSVGGWGLNTAARRMGLGAKERIRAKLVHHTAKTSTVLVSQGSKFSVPVTATLASSGIDKLDDYFTKFIPALVSAVVLPPLLGTYILYLDLTSAVILVLTIPLVPLFMALIGMHTQDKVAESQQGLNALARQLYELALGLPALLGLGRARAQGTAIASLGQRYRQVTMENLKTVFMSSFWLELISTLSVAVVAVFIGLRLVNGNMELSAGLIVLILAPELFSVLREVGSSYHAADDGLAAYTRYEQMTTPDAGSKLAVVTAQPAPGQVLSIKDLSVHYANSGPILSGYNLDLAPGEHHLLNARSGSGKTTLLKVIAESQGALGIDPQLVGGSIALRGQLAVIDQHPVFSEVTGLDQLRLDAPQASSALVNQLAGELALTALLEHRIAEYSPGELRRLEVLRALVRVHSVPECQLLLADEPTAHLDQANARAVRRLLGQLPENCAALIASHDPLLGPAASSEASLPTAPDAQEEQYVPRQGLPAGGQDAASDAEVRSFNPLRELLIGYRASKKAVSYGVLSVICAVGLSAVSGWLIVQASYQPPILHLMVAIVMVRALGIGRAALRYVEQLAIHEAVLEYSATLREKIWNAMVTRPGHWGIVSRSPVVLRFLLAEVDELRDLLARVIFPPVQALIVWLLGVASLFIIQPEFGYLALAVLLFLALVLPVVVRRVEGRSLALQMAHRLEVNEQVLGILRNRGSLRAYGSLQTLLGRLRDSEHVNTGRARRHALGQGIGPAVATLGGTLLAIACTAVSQVSAELTAVVALLALALIEPAGSALTALQQSRALAEIRHMLAARGVMAGNENEPQHRGQPTPPVHGFNLEALDLGYAPGRPVVRSLDGRIEPGQWTAVTGPSGSGKSTLLTALLGALKPLGGQINAIDAHGGERALSASDLDSVAWCPQEAHLFDSTLARNLALGVAGALPPEAELIQVLQQVGLGSWYIAQPQGLNTRIGSGGHTLSGGQRCRLAVARALLSDKQVILLDEPTAHLGHEEGEKLIKDLQLALAGRTVVLITHDARLVDACQEQISLSGAPVGIRA